MAVLQQSVFHSTEIGLFSLLLLLLIERCLSLTSQRVNLQNEYLITSTNKGGRSLCRADIVHVQWDSCRHSSWRNTTNETLRDLRCTSNDWERIKVGLLKDSVLILLVKMEGEQPYGVLLKYKALHRIIGLHRIVKSNPTIWQWLCRFRYLHDNF